MAKHNSGSNWINELPDDIRDIAMSRMSMSQFGKGEVIYREGQVYTTLWQVVSGTVRVTNQTEEGKEVVFAIFGPGDCFGEISLVDGLPAANTATAMEQLKLAQLSKADFDDLFLEYSEFARQLAQLLCGRVRHLLNFYSDVTLRPLEQRIASRICYISGGGVGGSAMPTLEFTQQDLAAMVGATRQAVSKVLNQWRGDGIIALEYGRISVLSEERLQRIVDGD